jgi:hypothetical protein
VKAKASDNIQDLTGQGLEFLMDKAGNVRLEFFDGHIVRHSKSGNNDVTVIPMPDDSAIDTMFKQAESHYVPLGIRDIPETDNVIHVDFVNKRRIS